ncbi:M20/M25/M40 family metallo-hydrolase [Pantoea sp. AS142]|uniref:M20/M25/M40 family metallo-hydrolase n=1 Tax=Pantoea sp. AS142 TaxID=3081292 RepID=UPI003018CD60
MSITIPAISGEQLIAFRHELHQFPELSNQEFETTARLRGQREQQQIRILDLPLKTGLVAEIGTSGGPLVVLRADIDALPIEEQSGVSYRSQRPGVMHACGHDFHSAAALGAAILLKQQAEKSGFDAHVVEASPIGEDFAFYQQQLPGAFMMIGTGEPYALHHPAFRVNDEVLLPTAHYLADLARAALVSLAQPQ